MPKLDTLENSVERKVRGEAKKEIVEPKSFIITKELVKEAKKKAPKLPKFVIDVLKPQIEADDIRYGSEICDPIGLYIRAGEERPNSIIDELRTELRKEQIRQQVVEEHFAFDDMSDEEQREFFENESDFELPDDHPSILTAYEREGIVYDASKEVPTNPDTPLNQTENPPADPPPADPADAPADSPPAE
ncbi:hypothetical protein [Eel River basin pequenovirus]|nr:hypothetical protein [Eel River basin pequenovirus]